MCFLDLYQRAQWDHLAFAIARFEACDRFRMLAELRVGLRDHLEGPAKAVEVIHVKRAKINLHGLEKILQRHALGLGLDTIDVRVQLRHVHCEGGE